MQTVPLLHSNLWDIGDPQTVALQSLLKTHSKQTGIKNCPEQKGLLRQIVRNTFTFFVHNCFCNRPLKFCCRYHIWPTAVVIKSKENKNVEILGTLKGTVQRDFRPPVFYHSNRPGPLTNGLK